jgi:hypothetical protein
MESPFQNRRRRRKKSLISMKSGQDTEFRRVVTVRDPNVTLGGLPSGAQVTVRIVAANDAGESAPSAGVEAQVPVLTRAA